MAISNMEAGNQQTAISLKVLFLYLFVPSRFEIVYNGKILFFMVHFIVITIEF